MNHAEINNFIVSTEDELTVTPPTAKGGKPKKADIAAKKQLDKYGLDIASDFFTQAIVNIQQAQKIVEKIAQRLDYDLKEVE